VGITIFEGFDVEAITADLSSRWLMPDGHIRLLPAEEFQSVPLDHLRIWCHSTARYGIPTLELIIWLKNRIGTLKALEIGAGNGDLGYHLGITMIDNYHQQNPLTQALYHISGQVPTNPPEEVKKYEAIDAIKKAKPQVVIGSWITRKFIQGRDIQGQSEANVYGPIEEDILKNCRCYIHIGNYNIHRGKTILSKKHSAFTFPWLVSRAEDQQQNVIHVWER
jgi:hypothetical protein